MPDTVDSLNCELSYKLYCLLYLYIDKVKIFVTSQGKDHEFYPIPGSERSRHFNDDVIGPADEKQIIQFQIYLKDKFKEEKDRLLEEMANLLPAEREYLNPEEFASKYNADGED